MAVRGPFLLASLIVLAAITDVILTAPTPAVSMEPEDTTVNSAVCNVTQTESATQAPADSMMNLKQSPTESEIRNGTDLFQSKVIRPTTQADVLNKTGPTVNIGNLSDRVLPIVPGTQRPRDIKEDTGGFYHPKKKVLHILAGAGFGVLATILIVVFIVCAVVLRAARDQPAGRRRGDPAELREDPAFPQDGSHSVPMVDISHRQAEHNINIE
ncbi:Hypp6284 [Branchiostoma lanceolatum]|uniref:Hypp6284 protein n=1 Tax=Branchiostoma lanceolatum TaxID=7740 RepID=A0A8J9WI41_BRALA|nr:Hypp6284 [Branchiostoma lanceolatum]